MHVSAKNQVFQHDVNHAESFLSGVVVQIMSPGVRQPGVTLGKSLNLVFPSSLKVGAIILAYKVLGHSKYLINVGDEHITNATFQELF